MKTARETSPIPRAATCSLSQDIILEISSPELPNIKNADTGVVLVPIKTEEQKNCDERYRRVMEAGKKQRKDYSAAESASYGEDEDTLFGVHSLLTDATTSMVPPRSANDYSSMPPVAQLK